MAQHCRIFLLLILAALSSGCVGMIVGQTTSAAIEVAKVPFKVGGAVIDVASGDDDDDNKKDEKGD